MEIVGYIVQVFNEDNYLPETGFKHLYTVFQHALDFAKIRVQDYTNMYQDALDAPYEYHSPTKKQTDENGYSIVFRNTTLQVWIEVISK